MGPATRLWLCPACGTVVDFLGPGGGGRPHATCPRCSALERHRFLALLLTVFTDRAADGWVLDVAPSRPIAHRLRALQPRRTVAIDFDPAADGRAVDLVASLTNVPLADRTISLLVCYHVLEHVPDDLAAMREIARLLDAGGIALVQVPWRLGQTDEDPSAGPEERVRRFGQADHVRWYGEDFVPRLQKSGLQVTELRPADVLSTSAVSLFGLIADEPVWIASSVAPPPSVHDVAHRMESAMDDLLATTAGRLFEAQRAEADARAQAQRWERAYRRLRGRLPIRLLADARRILPGRGSR